MGAPVLGQVFQEICPTYRGLIQANTKAFHSNSKYPLKRSLSDAINLLRKAYPEVAID